MTAPASARRRSFADRLVASWYAPRLTILAALLLPLSLVFRSVVAVRRALYRAGVFRSIELPVPVVVVGNITVGGSGKTPLVIALARALAERGFDPAIVSRGYGGTAPSEQRVTADADPVGVGDEPLLMARSGLDVWIGRDRVAAARAVLAQKPGCNVIISDDGLQHYALGRALEIVAVGPRGFGNGQLLPAGPLREPVSRLQAADALVVSGDANVEITQRPLFAQTLTGDRFVRVNETRDAVGDVADATRFATGRVYAIAGIAEPERFFERLRAMGLRPLCHAFPDHHAFTSADLDFPDAGAILMTEKDAVKCRAFADDRCWMLPVRAVIDPHLVTLVEEKLRGREAA